MALSVTPTLVASIDQLAALPSGKRRRLLRYARQTAADTITEANYEQHCGATVTICACEAIERGEDPLEAVRRLVEGAQRLIDEGAV